MSYAQELIRDRVEKYGLAIQFAFPTEEGQGPRFAYTIGMTDIGHPELLVIGLPDELAGLVFNQVHGELRKGQRTGRELLIEKILSVPLLVHATDPVKSCAYTIQGDEYYRIKGLKPVYSQLIWPDPAGVYPHQDGFDEDMREIQPYLGIS